MYQLIEEWMNERMPRSIMNKWMNVFYGDLRIIDNYVDNPLQKKKRKTLKENIMNKF